MIDKINIVRSNHEYRNINLNLANEEHFKGTIKIENSIFENCHITIDNFSIEHIDVMLLNNQFINCKLLIKSSEILNHITKFNDNSFKNCSFAFLYTKFYNKYLDFHDLNNLDEIFFIKCILYSYINFEDSSIKKVIFINCMLENDVDLRLKKCNELIVESSKINKLLNLTFKDKLAINSLNLFNNINLGQILIDWEKNNVVTLIKNNKKRYQVDDFNQIMDIPLSTNDYANQFLLLKENYRKQGKFAYEDYAYVEYRKYLERKNIYSNIGSLIGKYGTRPLEILISMVYIIIIFAFVFNFVEKRTINLTTFFNYLYFSGITFFTIGYSDILVETDLSRFIALIEAFIGVFLMAYFTGSFIRKVLR